MGLTCVSIIMAVAVSNIYHQRTLNRDVPRWLRCLSFYLNKLVRIQTQKLHRSGTDSPEKARSSPPNARTPLNTSYTDLQGSRFIRGCLASPQEHHNRPDSIDFENKHALDDSTIKMKKLRKLSCGTGPVNGQITLNTEDQKKLFKKINTLLNSLEEKLNKLVLMHENVNKEWQEVSEILDRFLFFLYTIVTASVTVVILLIVPLGKNSKI